MYLFVAACQFRERIPRGQHRRLHKEHFGCKLFGKHFNSHHQRIYSFHLTRSLIFINNETTRYGEKSVRTVGTTVKMLRC